ncbi:MAG TPA: glycosyltransferase family 4 protein [Bacteroidota bacterium]|nr:glycosyltransferase family 4 protein [Bacteroidota bacterium]
MSGRTVLIGLPMLRRGGTEIQTLALVRALQGKSWRVVVCCYYEHEPRIVEEFQAAGAEVLNLGLRRSSGPGSLSELIRLFFALVRTCQRVRPEAVHVQYVAPGLVPILAAKAAGVRRIFATIHYPCHGFGARERWLVRFGARLCSLFICNSLATENSWFGSSIAIDDPAAANRRLSHCTVYNCVDYSAVAESALKYGRRESRTAAGVSGSNVIGVVARLRSEKGHRFLLEAMPAVLGDVPDCELLVVGDGPDKEVLRSLASKLGIADRVIWMGERNSGETYRLYGAMDILVVPSEFEGFGLSAAEGMAAGLPVIASDVGGLREVVADGSTGYLVPFGERTRLASAIVSLLLSPERREAMGKTGQRRVGELFSRSRFEKAIAKVYDKF